METLEGKHLRTQLVAPELVQRQSEDGLASLVWGHVLVPFVRSACFKLGA